jgi:hypothetical protein
MPFNPRWPPLEEDNKKKFSGRLGTVKAPISKKPVPRSLSDEEEEDYTKEVSVSKNVTNVSDVLQKISRDNEKAMRSIVTSIEKIALDNSNALENIVKTINGVAKSQKGNTDETSKVLSKLLGTVDETTVNLAQGLESIITSILEKTQKKEASNDDIMSFIRGFDSGIRKSGETVVISPSGNVDEDSIRGAKIYSGIESIVTKEVDEEEHEDV